MIFEDEIVNNKAFEHANLIFTEPLALTIMHAEYNAKL